MLKRNVSLGFWAGLAPGAVAMLALSGGQVVPRASAQQQPAEENRYQLQAWATRAVYGSNSFTNASHGAYILDNSTGRVWHIEEMQKPQLLGKIQ
jgi:hypothetical protein